MAVAKVRRRRSAQTIARPVRDRTVTDGLDLAPYRSSSPENGGHMDGAIAITARLGLGEGKHGSATVPGPSRDVLAQPYLAHAEPRHRRREVRSCHELEHPCALDPEHATDLGGGYHQWLHPPTLSAAPIRRAGYRLGVQS